MDRVKTTSSDKVTKHSWHSLLHLCTRLSRRPNNKFCKPHIGRKIVHLYSNLFPTSPFQVSRLSCMTIRVHSVGNNGKDGSIRFACRIIQDWSCCVHGNHDTFCCSFGLDLGSSLSNYFRADDSSADLSKHLSCLQIEVIELLGLNPSEYRMCLCPHLYGITASCSPC